MRILITASRDYTNKEEMRHWIEYALEGKTFFDDVLVHGDKEGGDRLAEEIAADLGITAEAHPARGGKVVQVANNTKLVTLRIDMCLAFPGAASAEVWDCAQKAASAGIETMVIYGGKHGC